MKFKHLFIVAITLLNAPLLSAQLKDYIQKMPNPEKKDKKEYYGEINWTTGEIEAQGVCFFKPSVMGVEYDIELSKAGAEADAKANLIAIINGTKVHDTVTVAKFSDNQSVSHITQAITEGHIRAMLVGEPKINGNKVTVTMRANIYGQGSIYELLAENAPETDTIFHKPLHKNIKRAETDLKPNAAPETFKVPTDYKAVLDTLKALGKLADTTTKLPPLIFTLPENEAKNFSPGIVPKLKIIQLDGSVNYMDVQRDLHIDVQDGNLSRIYKEMLPVLRLIQPFQQGSVIEGVIENNQIVVDLRRVQQNVTTKGYKSKFGKMMQSIGNIAMEIAPIILKVI